MALFGNAGEFLVDLLRANRSMVPRPILELDVDPGRERRQPKPDRIDKLGAVLRIRLGRVPMPGERRVLQRNRIQGFRSCKTTGFCVTALANRQRHSRADDNDAHRIERRRPPRIRRRDPGDTGSARLRRRSRRHRGRAGADPGRPRRRTRRGRGCRRRRHRPPGARPSRPHRRRSPQRDAPEINCPRSRSRPARRSPVTGHAAVRDGGVRRWSRITKHPTWALLCYPLGHVPRKRV